MRDLNRIPRLLRSLAIVWCRNPDLRLGQLIENVSRGTYGGPQRDVFQIEDDELLERLREMSDEADVPSALERLTPRAVLFVSFFSWLSALIIVGVPVIVAAIGVLVVLRRGS